MSIMFFAFRTASTPEGSECNCGEPANLAKTEVTRSSITFDWDDRESATQYRLTSRKLGAGPKVSNYTTSASTFKFEDLTPGTYEFTFTTDCDGELSESIVISDVVF